MSSFYTSLVTETVYITDPTFYEDNPTVPNYPTLKLRPFKFIYQAVSISDNGWLVNVSDIAVKMDSYDDSFTESGRTVRRKSTIYDVVGFCNPLLPQRETVFTWDFRVLASYTYTPFAPPKSREFHYDKSVVMKAF